MNSRTQQAPSHYHRSLGWIATGLCLLLAGPAVADTFRIEIDYMVGTHSHQPSNAVIQAVQQMFACQGHTLIVQVDDAITHYNVLKRNPANCTQSLFTYSGSADSYGAIKAANFDNNGGGWHYCIFAHQYQDNTCSTTTSSGLANGSVDFIVTLGAFSGQTGTLFEQAATLAHEFGHNLGLSHCGTMDCGSDTTTATYVGPFVPNLPSIMSYRYQLDGVRANLLCTNMTIEAALFKDIDYSHGRMCTLNENNLNENRGTTMSPTDWDCDGTLEASVAQDINGGNNGWCGSTGNLTTMSDYNEWANITDVAGAGTSPQLLSIRSDIEYSCITLEEYQKFKDEQAGIPGCVQPALSTESCLSSQRMVYVGTLAGVEDGRCVRPYDSLQQAHDAAPNNSVFWLLPGTINEAGSVLLDKPGTYWANGGSAVVQ